MGKVEPADVIGFCATIGVLIIIIVLIFVHGERADVLAARCARAADERVTALDSLAWDAACNHAKVAE